MDEQIVTGTSDLIQEVNCNELESMFSGLSLDDLGKIPGFKLPKIDLSEIKLNIKLKVKFDEMFKDFSIEFPDLELPGIDFNINFDFMANLLKLPKIGEIKTPPNPLEGLGDKALDLLKNFADCDKFKSKIVDPGMAALNESIMKGE